MARWHLINNLCFKYFLIQRIIFNQNEKNWKMSMKTFTLIENILITVKNILQRLANFFIATAPKWSNLTPCCTDCIKTGCLWIQYSNSLTPPLQISSTFQNDQNNTLKVVILLPRFFKSAPLCWWWWSSCSYPARGSLMSKFKVMGDMFN